jgi:hypothetical protein
MSNLVYPDSPEDLFAGFPEPGGESWYNKAIERDSYVGPFVNPYTGGRYAILIATYVLCADLVRITDDGAAYSCAPPIWCNAPEWKTEAYNALMALVTTP